MKQKKIILLLFIILTISKNIQTNAKVIDFNEALTKTQREQSRLEKDALEKKYQAEKKRKEKEKPDKNKLYKEALDYLKNSQFSFAAESFEKVEENFPFTTEAKKSILMAIYCHYKSNKFEEALMLIELNEKVNFNLKDLEYIQFIRVLSNVRKSKKQNKNIELARETLELIKELEVKINNKKYITTITKEKQNLIDRIIHLELDIVNYYIATNNVIGALNHLKEIEQNYNYSNYLGEIHYRLFELNTFIQHQEEAEKYFKRLEQYSQNTKWYNNVKKYKQLYIN